MQQTVSGTKMGKIPKAQRAALHVSKDTRERVKRCLDILAAERVDSTLTIEDVVNEMVNCFESKRSQ
jgi:hypothetical protein